MRKDIQDKISDIMGCKPILINSALVSAQNRQRLYWTNIPNIEQPEDKGLVLQDILEDSWGMLVDRDKSHCLDANYWKGGNLKSYFNKNRRQLVFNRCYQTGEADLKGLESLKRTYDKRGKSPTLTTCGGGHREPKLTVDQYTWRKLTPLECERLQTVPEGYTEGVSNTQRYRMLGNGWTVDVIAHILDNMIS
jgi:site-specific DNA-cytosine methylase